MHSMQLVYIIYDFTITIAFLHLISATNVRVSCVLSWIPEGYGNIPSNSIESRPNEFVIRVYHEGLWIPGRLNPGRGKAIITSDGRVLELNTYEVLVNPDNCELDWVDGYGGIFPEHSVSVESKLNPGVLIGRTEIDGVLIGGKVVISNSAIYVANQGVEELRRNYQVLISVYPLLQAKLSRFRFNLDDLDGKNKSELFGQEEIKNNFDSEFLQIVTHGKIVEERFVLVEEGLDWAGLTKIFLSFPLWYGTSDVSATFNLEGEMYEEELVVVRNREVKTHRELSVQTGSPTNTMHIQVCSVLNIIEDLETPITFEAIGTFKAEKLTGKQISYILQELGRTVKTTRKHSVDAVVKGTLNGRFAIHVSNYISKADTARGLCFGYQ